MAPCAGISCKCCAFRQVILRPTLVSCLLQSGRHHADFRSLAIPAPSGAAVLPVAGDAAVFAGHQHRQRRPAGIHAGIRRALPVGAVGRAGLSAGHHDCGRQRRAAGRPDRPAAPDAVRAGVVYRRVGAVRGGARPVDAGGRARRAGHGRGRVDDACHGLCRRGGAEGAGRQRHGSAGHDVGGRHRPRSDAWRGLDRRGGLAGDLPGESAAGAAGVLAGLAAPAPRCAARRASTGSLRLAGQHAAGADAGHLCAVHDTGPRQSWGAQCHSAGCGGRRRGPVHVGAGADGAAAGAAGHDRQPVAGGRVCGQRAGRHGDDGDLGGGAVLSVGRAGVGRRAGRAGDVLRPARGGAGRRAGGPLRGSFRQPADDVAFAGRGTPAPRCRLPRRRSA